MKLIDIAKERSISNICPHCNLTMAMPDGLPLAICDGWKDEGTGYRAPAKIMTVSGMANHFEPCTLEDYAVCPFKEKEEKGHPA